MKKKAIAGIMILAGALFYIGEVYAQEAAPGEAYIREFSGTVEVKTPGATAWRAARKGERIQLDTVISTGLKSSALIVLGNSTITVRPLTRLNLEELQRAQQNESVTLRLHTGRIRADVKPPEEGRTDFTIRSPTVTASVRGTAFDFDGINLRVDQGRVYVTGGDGIGLFVGAGQESVSNPQTGQTSGGAELIRAAMALPIPAAMENGPGPKPDIPTGKIVFGLKWQ
jgi:hypothetical protein